MRKIIFILSALIAVAIIILLFIAFSAMQNRAVQDPGFALPTQIPITPVRLGPIPQSTKKLPTTQPSQIDLSAQATQTSIQEISKLKDLLPYTNSFVSSLGVPVQIYIPALTQQERTWTLQVETLGVNFQITQQDPKYASTRQSFRESAQIVLGFLASHNINPKNIFITWGNRAYEQETAEKWLQN